MMRTLSLVLTLGVAAPCAGEEFRCTPADQVAAPVALVEAFCTTADTNRAFIAVLAADGAAVRHQVLHAAAGEPLQVLVDTGAAKPYRLVVDASRPPAKADDWIPPAGVVVEVRSRQGDNVGSLTGARQVWDRSPVQGRTLVDQIFLGVNPCGPTRDVCLRFTAHLRIGQAGTYGFSTMSADASFVAIDGQPVTEWPGWHDPHPGRRGQHMGRVELSAGVHRVDYLLVQRGEWLCATLAWQPPDAQHPVVVPPTAFVPVARWSAIPADGGPRVEWRSLGHTQVGDDWLIEMQFTAHLPPRAVAGWRFDDDGTLRGNEVKRLFVRPGLRPVIMEAIIPDRPPVTIRHQVQVRPFWRQIQDWSDAQVAKARDELAKRDPASLPLADLAAVGRIAAAGDDRRLLEAVARSILPRATLDETGRRLLFDLGMAFQRTGVNAPDRCEVVWRRLLEVDRSHSRERERAALHLAGMHLHVLDRAAEAKPLLDALVVAALEGDEKRLGVIYRGDAAAALGDEVAAQARYGEAGSVVAANDVGYSVRRRARLEWARDLIAQSNHEEAMRVLREIEWENPLTRMGHETGLLWVRLLLAREQPVAALARCRLMLTGTGPDGRRADVLFATAQAAAAAGRRNDAEAVLRQLAKDHPYSEAAAKAREWHVKPR